MAIQLRATATKRAPDRIEEEAPAALPVAVAAPAPDTGESPAWAPLIRGTKAPIVIVCDSPPPEAERVRSPISPQQLKFMSAEMLAAGLVAGEVAWVSLSPSIPQEIAASKAKRWDFVKPHVEAVLAAVRSLSPSLVVTMGELASRAVLGRAVAITKARGLPVITDKFDAPVLPILSPGYVMRLPDQLPAFKADINMIVKIRDAGFRIGDVNNETVDYKWVFDLEPLLPEVGRVITVDTETTGLVWHHPDTRVLTIQITPRAGVSWVLPVDAEYCAKWFPDFPEAARLKLLAQAKQLLEDGKVVKAGANFKYDHMMLRKSGIETQGWQDDTQLLAFCVDENMFNKSLDECIRVWVPEMAGYADEFNRTTDKSRMIDVPPEDMIVGNTLVLGMRNYAGGDTDATYRLAKVLKAKLAQDPRQMRCYRLIMMPAMLVFANSVERYGMAIDRNHLNVIEAELKEYVSTQYKALIRLVPPAVRLKHLKDGLSFRSNAFMQDILFSKEGFNLKPQLFTNTTKDLPAAQRVPQTGKDQLTYFVNHSNPKIAAFASGLISFGAAEKMLSTYVGNEEEGSGFHKYIAPDGNIYSSYMLHRTNTGRTASAYPNGQNFPKRSPKNGPDWAGMYQGIFMSRPGMKLVNCDLSQIELRLVAWMAQEERMLQIYREGGDIHTATAREAVLKMTIEQWAAQSGKEIKNNRFKAKAVNFGLVYGMSAQGFQVYAKTDYGLDLTLEEAEEIRNNFFRLYPGLPGWHKAMKDFARKNGYVRALHGAVRHLPSIYSNDRGIVAQAERQAVNAPIQRFGSDLGLMAMVRFASQTDPANFRLIGFVHDALVLECREGMEEEGAAYLRWTMETAPLERWFGLTSPIPILAECDIATGQTSASLEERPDIRPIKPPYWDDDEEGRIKEFVTRNRWLSGDAAPHSIPAFSLQ